MPFRCSLAGGQRAEEEAVNGTRVVMVVMGCCFVSYII